MSKHPTKRAGRSTAVARHRETLPSNTQLNEIVESAKPVAGGVAWITAGTAVGKATSSIPVQVMHEKVYEEVGYGFSFVLLFVGLGILAKRTFFPSKTKKPSALEDKRPN